jgi:hypothetical protein
VIAGGLVTRAASGPARLRPGCPGGQTGRGGQISDAACWPGDHLAGLPVSRCDGGHIFAELGDL